MVIPKKIFFLSAILNIGGAEKMHYEIARHLNSSMFAKRFCCLYGPGVIGETFIREGMDLTCNLMKNKYDLMGVYKLFRLLKREHVDILCIQNLPLTLFWGVICGRMLEIPSIIIVVHNMSDSSPWVRLKSKLVTKFIMNKIDKIIVVSKAKMDSLIREYNLNPDKLVLINNCVDIDKFMDLEDKDELKRKTGISCGEKVIGMVGRLVNEKAYDIFLKSAQRINRRIPDTKFLIIGDGIERQGLERLALSLGIEKQVIFLGERQDVPRIITLFDVAVLSSRIESFPVTLLEYMAASRPIVATNVGGNTEIVIDGKTGCIIPPEDPEALSDAVIALLNNRRKAEEMGRAAKRIVEDEFSLNHMINKMERLFLSCANESSTCLRGIPHLLASRRSRGKPRVRAGMPASNSWQGLTIGGDSERNSASARFSPRRSEKKESTGVSPWSFKKGCCLCVKR